MSDTKDGWVLFNPFDSVLEARDETQEEMWSASLLFCSPSRKSWPIAQNIPCWCCQQIHTHMNEQGDERTLTLLPMLHIYLIKWQLAVLRLHHAPYRLDDSPDSSWQIFHPSFDNATKTMTRQISDACLVYSYVFSHLKMEQYPPLVVKRNTSWGSFWNADPVQVEEYAQTLQMTTEEKTK